MKRVILSVTALGLLGIFGVGMLLAAGYQKTQQLQTPVFEAIAQENIEALMDLCDPSVRDQIDPPMLATWMRALNDSLGECQFEPAGTFSVSFEKKPGKTIVKSSGKMKFERGTATSDLVFLNGKIVSFNIDSDRLGKDWFNGPTETTFYQKRSETVIRMLLERRLDDLKPMMHPALLEAANDETLNNICDLGEQWAGNVKSVVATKTDFQRDENEQLMVGLEVVGDKGNMDATVTFTFDGLKGHLTAFNIQPAE